MQKNKKHQYKHTKEKNNKKTLIIIAIIIIILTMYFGRVGPISMAIAFGGKNPSRNIIKNPTEEISIG